MSFQYVSRSVASRAGLAAIASVCMGAAALAQTPPASDPQFTTATYGDWVVECRLVTSTPPAAAPAAPADGKAKAPEPKAAATPASERMCEMVQTFTFRETGRQLAKIAVGKLTGQTNVKAVVELPLAVYLPDGVVVKMDDKNEIKGQFIRCTAVSCLADIDMAPAVASQLEAAKATTVTFTDLGRRKVSIGMSMSGYGSAFKAAMSQQSAK